jgi:hypothetical protein
MVRTHFYLFEGRRFENMKEVMDYLRISREGFRILRIVNAIERINNNDKLKEVGQNEGERNNTRI